MKVFWRLLGFLRPYRWGVIASLVLATVAMASGVVIPYLVGRAVDQIRAGELVLWPLALAIVGAEYVAGVVPVGTHEWDKFVTPRELHARMRTRGLVVRRSAGMRMSPLTCAWSLDDADLDVNYIVAAQRPAPRDDDGHE